MNENDLSDEAFWKWVIDTFEFTANKPTWQEWQECRRRAEAIIEERERKAFRAAITRTWHDISDEYFEELWTAYKEQRDAEVSR